MKLRGSPNFVFFCNWAEGRKRKRRKGTRFKHISKESWSWKRREKDVTTSSEREGVLFPSTNFFRNEGRNPFKENLINDENAPGLHNILRHRGKQMQLSHYKMQNSQDSNESFKRRRFWFLIIFKMEWSVFEVWKYAFYRAIGSYLERFWVGPSSYDDSLRKYLVETELFLTRIRVELERWTLDYLKMREIGGY